MSGADRKRLISIVRKCETPEGALEAARLAFPARRWTREILRWLLRPERMGEILRPPEVAKNEELDRLIALARAGTRTLEGLCDALELSPKKVRALVDVANAAGFRVACVGDRFGLTPTTTEKRTVSVVMPAQHRHTILVASDIHVGSKYFLREQFQDHIHRGYEAGARVCLVPGDILDGCYDHSRWEESQHGFEEQASEAARVFPRLEGLRYIGITGNHDQTFEHRSGLSVVQALPQRFQAAGRKDLELLGARGAFLRLGSGSERGLLVEMWHPLKGPAYALSYKLQKHIEGYQVGGKPDVLLTGHWHQSCFVFVRGVHAMSCGTFHGGQSDFGKALGGAPAIGGWQIQYAVTKEGTVREFTPTWRAYYESEHVRVIRD